MGDIQTVVRTEVAVNGSSFFLAQGQDLDDLKRRIEDAARTGGTFVQFTVVGNRSVSVLISSASQVVFSVETVELDSRDTGDEDMPYGGLYDF